MWNASTKFEGDLQEGRLFHAYFLSGPEDQAPGLLERWSHLLLCRDPRPADGHLEPCGRCLSCQAYLPEGHPDSFWPRGSSLGVEEVRQAIQFASYHPYVAPRRVVILGPLRLMGAEAANALLKTLEEPPFGTVFLLYNQSRLEVLPTILSRCRILELTGEVQVPPEVVERVARELREFREGKVSATQLAQRWAQSHGDQPLLEVLALLLRDALALYTGGEPQAISAAEGIDLGPLWKGAADPWGLLLELRRHLAFHVQAENAFLQFLLRLEVGA